MVYSDSLFMIMNVSHDIILLCHSLNNDCSYIQPNMGADSYQL